ncbi:MULTISPECIES: ABC transporter permease subunit [unclassified Achromobacter]|uniref:ABC transporter permease n=1 Tax=unclassified Achromobacter TaxID=2626865 RepID=UPI000B517FBB|nr:MULTISPECIES: ABC transporter permease subunit [unclassified Achromobacter]OWT80538.1 sulfonate ABC transporter permease [Achromobacter sp. HZ34]OWT82421.1 sulfonate ABC transporter permease [Achromobacter sp. HZ28]
MFPFFDPRRLERLPGTRPNRWDWLLLPLILGFLVLLAFGAKEMATPYSVGQQLPISLDAAYLPYYLLRTTLRMFIALGVSLVFSFVFAAVASKSRTAEKILVPMVDILQSIPILGFLSITVTGFIALFPGRLLGVECAAIFAIFTSQAWNMALSLYQSIRTVPSELNEAARVFRLSGWQRFWRLELPYATPALLWNMMLSMSGGWFFVVASEAITVSNQDIMLPGIGSYIASAIDQQNLHAIFYAIIAMAVGILLYDQLFFRPLLAWADKFRFEDTQSNTAQQSWVLDLLRRGRLTRALSLNLAHRGERALGWFRRGYDGTSVRARVRTVNPLRERMVDGFLTALALIAVWRLGVFVHAEVGWSEALRVLGLGGITLVRVMVLIALASVVWVPLGIMIGLRPRLSQRIQALAQLLAAFPSNLLFPLAVVAIVAFDLNPEVWLSPLMIFGTQWYILFNVVAGASTIPSELRYAADNLGLKGWLKWKRFYLPAVFPSFVTGAITASGGSWNASIVSEVVTWGKTTLTATGLGGYIAEMTQKGDFPRIALGIGVMCIFVMGLNRYFWRRLYLQAEKWSR